MEAKLRVRRRHQLRLYLLEFSETPVDVVSDHATLGPRERDVMLEVTRFGCQQAAVKTPQYLRQPRCQPREPLVEPHGTDNLIREPTELEDVFERARLRVGAVQRSLPA